MPKKKSLCHRKVYLTFPGVKTKEAIICEMYDKHRVKFNIRSASVTDNLGLIALELEGKEADIEKALAFFRKRGLTVEPIELGVMAG